MHPSSSRSPSASRARDPAAPPRATALPLASGAPRSFERKLRSEIALAFLTFLVALFPAAAACAASSTASASPFLSNDGTLSDGFHCAAPGFPASATCDDVSAQCEWEIAPPSPPFLSFTLRSIAPGDSLRVWDGDVASAIPAQTVDGNSFSAPVSGRLVIEYLPDDNGVVGAGFTAVWTTEKPSLCGDGVVDAAWEVCDLGSENGVESGCSADCTAITPGMACSADGTVCRAGCGDALWDAAVEECDDGNLVDGDGCNASCRVERDCSGGPQAVIGHSHGHLVSSTPGRSCFYDVMANYNGPLELLLVKQDMTTAAENGIDDDVSAIGSWSGAAFTPTTVFGEGQTIDLASPVEFTALPHRVRVGMVWQDPLVIDSFPERLGAHFYFHPAPPTITSVASPVPTAGGLLTLTGSDFPSRATDILSIDVAGTVCVPRFASSSSVVCVLADDGYGGDSLPVRLIVPGGESGLGRFARVASSVPLAAHWPMNEMDSDASFVPDVHGSFNGRLASGAVHTSTDCQSTGCVYFDGTTSARVDMDPDATIDESVVTVSVWLNRQGTTGNQDGRIISKADSADDSDAFFRLNLVDDAGFEFLVRCDGTVRTLAVVHAVPINTWMHVVASKDTDRLVMYVDGVEVGELDLGSDLAVDVSATARTTIGNDVDAHVHGFRGLLDDLRLYTEEISSASAALALGNVDVAMSSNQFAYAPPSVTASEPASGSVHGGFTVTLFGNSFGAAAQPTSNYGDLFLNGVAVCTPVIVSHSEMTCTFGDVSASGLCDVTNDWAWERAGLALVSTVSFTTECCVLSGLAFQVEPETSTLTTFGSTLPTQPSVGVLAAGVVSTDAGCALSTATVLIELIAGDGTLSGTTSVAAVDGIASFTDLAIAQGVAAGDLFQLRASLSTVDAVSSFFTLSEASAVVSASSVVGSQGETLTWSFNLVQSPVSDVTVTVSAADCADQVSFPGGTMAVFSPADWDDPQTLSVSVLVDDDVSDNGCLATLRPTSDDAALHLVDGLLAVTARDDDVAQISGAVVGSASVAESAGEGLLSVVLISEPQDNVTVSAVLSPTTFATASTASLVFTPASWSTAQTVTVTGTEDGDAYYDAPETTVNLSTTSDDDDFAGLVDSATFFVVDNDAIAPEILLSGIAGVTVAEGDTETFTVTLSASPSADVVVHIDADDAGDIALQPLDLTFSPSNFDTAQTFTLSSFDNVVDNLYDPRSVAFAATADSTDEHWFGVSTGAVSLLVEDDDVASIVVSSSSTVVVSEGSTDDTISISLASMPVSAVTLVFSSTNSAALAPPTTNIVFSPTNYGVAATATVSAVEDAVAYDPSSFDLVVGVISDDPVYHLATVAFPEFAVTQNEAAGLAVTPASISLDEAKVAQAKVGTVKLDTMPTDLVTVGLTSSAATVAGVLPSSATFAPTNYDVPLTFTVACVDNNVDIIGSASATVTLTASSDDAAQNGLTGSVGVTVTDDDTARFVATATEVFPDEDGGTSTFSVWLGTEPGEAVTASISTGSASIATVSPATIVFASGTWSTAATVTVTGVDNGSENTPFAETTVGVSLSSSDTIYASISPSDIDVVLLDDDRVGPVLATPAVTTLLENGGISLVSVVLTSSVGLLNSVTVNYEFARPGVFTASPSAVSFGSLTWASPQIVTVTAVADSVDSAIPLSSAMIFASSGQSNFNNKIAAPFTLEIVDDDTAGVTFSGESALSVAENGGTDTFTVVLDTEPESDVFVRATPDNVAHLSLAVPVLTFTPGNYASVQTFSVTAESNDFDSNSDPLAVPLSLSISSFDDIYDAMTFPDLSVDIAEDDSADISVSAASFTIAESSTPNTDTFTLALVTRPTSMVTVAVSVGDASVAGTLTASVMFTGVNFAGPATVTVTGVDNAVDEATDATTSVSFAVTSDDGAYHAHAIPAVAVELTDEDVSGFSLSATSGEAGENGETVTFTVQLTTQPLGPVTVTAVSGDSGVATASVAPSVFTASNYGQFATVTVTGVDNGAFSLSDATAVVALDFQSSGDAVYDGLTVTSFTATLTDEDRPNFPSLGAALTIAEDGGADSWTFDLDFEPADDVFVSLVFDATVVQVTTPTAFGFTPGDYSIARTVSVLGVDNDVDLASDPATMISFSMLSADGDWDGLTGTANVVLLDDDVAAVSLGGDVSPTIGEGLTSTFTVALATEPTALVTVSVAGDNLLVADAGAPASFVFDAANYAAVQTATIETVDDVIDHASDPTANIVVSVASSDGQYDGVATAPVAVEVTDNDTFGVTQSATTRTVAEAGGEATLTVFLETEPVDAVTMSISADSSNVDIVSSTPVVFSTAAWSVPTTVTVRGVDNDVDEADSTTTVSFALTSDDTVYHGISAAGLTVTATDDDTGAVSQSTTAVTVSEAGGIATVVVTLATEPAELVTMTMSPDDAAVATAVPTTVTFSAGMWSDGSTVTVSGVDNGVDAPSDATTFVSLSLSSGDSVYDVLTITDVTVTSVDDDTTGVTQSALAATVDEDGGTETMTFVLDSEPTSTVSVAIGVDDASVLSLTPTSVTFTSITWSDAAVVTFTGAADAVDTTTDATAVVSFDFSSDDGVFHLIGTPDVTVTSTDNDVAGTTQSETAVVVAEAAGDETFTVVLTSEPVSAVTISPVSSDATVSGSVDSELVFAPNEWSDALVVTITGVADDIDNGSDRTAQIELVLTSDDAKYDAHEATDVTVTATDDDTFGVTQSATDVTVTEAGDAATISIVLDSEPVSSVSVTILSSDDAVAGASSSSSIVFSSSTWSIASTVTMTAVDDDIDQVADATTQLNFAFSSDDASYASLSTAVSVTSTDDDAAGVTLTASVLTVSEDGGEATVAIVLDSEPLATVTVSVSSDDASVDVTSSSVEEFLPSEWSEPITVTLVGVDNSVDAGSDATAQISFALSSDDPTYASETVADVTVTSVDDDVAGVFASVETMTLDENGGIGSFTIVLGSLPSLAVTVTTTTSSAAELTVTSNGAVTFSTSNWSEPRTISVQAVDDSSVSATSVSLTSSTVSLDGSYLAKSDSIDVTIVDDEFPQFLFSQTTMTISEAEGEGVFHVSLDESPLAPVVLTISSSLADLVEPIEDLTFTALDHSALRTVTVTAVDNQVDGLSSQTTLLSGSSSSADSNFDGLSSPSAVSVVVTDDDVSALASVPGLSTRTVAEGESSTLRLKLATRPSSAVTLTVAMGNSAIVSAPTAPIVVAAADFDVGSEISVAMIDTAVDEPASEPRSTTLTFTAQSGDGKYHGLSMTRTFVALDDDVAAATYSTSTVSIGGVALSSSELTVALATEPVTPVTVSFAAVARSASKLILPAALVFSPQTYSTPQTAAIAVNDALAPGSYVEVVQSFVSTTDAVYASVVGQNTTVTFNITDPMSPPIVSRTNAGVRPRVLAGTTSVLDTIIVVDDANGVGNLVLNATSSSGAAVRVESTVVSSPTQTETTLAYAAGPRSLQTQDEVTVRVTDSTGIVRSLMFVIAISQGLVIRDGTQLPVVVSENQDQSTAALVVGLDYSPTEQVAVTVAGPSNLALALSTASLAGEMPTATLTIEAIDNDEIDGTRQQSVVLSSPGMLDLVIAVSVLDNDIAGIAVVTSLNNVTYESGVAPGNATNVITVSMYALRQPSSAVVVPVQVDTPEICAVSKTSIEIPSDETFFEARSLVVSAVQDDFDLGEFLECRISFPGTESDDADFDPPPPADPLLPVPSAVTFTVVDDDTFGFRAVLPDAGDRVLTDGDVTLTEGVAGAVLRNGDVVPAGGSFGGVAVSVVLTAALRAESYTVSIGGNGQLETQPAELVFDGGAPWSVAQTMLVRALDDEALDGDVVATLLGVNVTVVDNEVQAIVLDGLDSVVVDEDAGAIALPLSTRFPLPVGESVAVVATLGGQSVSGMAPGVVRLPMTGNSIDDGDRNVTLLVTPTPTLSMPIEPLRVDVLVLDNDVPSIFDPNSNDVLLTSEDGTSVTFELGIGCEPRGEVVVVLRSTDETEGLVGGADAGVLTWTPGNWDAMATVTVIPVDDDERDSIVEYAVESIAVSSTDPSFNRRDVQLHRPILNKDNDFVGVQVSPSVFLQENGNIFTAQKQVLFVLTLTPLGPVNVRLDYDGDGRIAVPTSEFQILDDLPVIQTISAVDNLRDDDDATVVVTVSAADGAETFPNTEIVVSVVDDDVAAFESNGLSQTLVVSEREDSVSGSVWLATEPFGDVVVALEPSDATEAVVSPGTLTFSPFNWSEPGQVVVSGVSDLDNLDGSVVSSIRVFVRETTVSRDEIPVGQLDMAVPLVTTGVFVPQMSLAADFSPVSPFGGGRALTLSGDFFLDGLVVRVIDSYDDSVVEVQANVTGLHTVSLPNAASHQRQTEREFGTVVVFETPSLDTTGGDRYPVLRFVNPDDGGDNYPFETLVYYSNTCPEENTVLSPKDNRCISCPVGASCPGGNRIIPLAGYWTEDVTSGYVIECQVKERCVGGNAAACADGYQGPGCLECASGFYKTGDTCEDCGDPEQAKTTVLLLVTSVAILFGSFILVCWFLSNGAMTNVTVVIIQIQLIQRAGSTAVQFLPLGVRSFYSTLSIINVDVNFVRADCTEGALDFSAVFLITLGMVVSILTPMVLGLEIIGRMRKRIAWYRRRMVRSVLVTLAIVYLMLCRRIFQAIFCTVDPKGDLVLVAEPSTVCYEGDHWPIAVLAWFLVIFFALGFPIGVALVIFRKRRTRYDATFCDMLGYFFEGFHHRQFLFGSFAFILPFAVSFSSVFLAGMYVAQFLVVAGIALVLLGYYISKRPFRRSWKNYFSVLPVLVTIFSAILTFVFLAGGNDNIMVPLSWTLFIFSALILAAFAVSIVSSLGQWRSRSAADGSQSSATFSGKQAESGDATTNELERGEGKQKGSPTMERLHRARAGRVTSDFERLMLTSDGKVTPNAAPHGSDEEEDAEAESIKMRRRLATQIEVTTPSAIELEPVDPPTPNQVNLSPALPRRLKPVQAGESRVLARSRSGSVISVTDDSPDGSPLGSPKMRPSRRQLDLDRARALFQSDLLVPQRSSVLEEPDGEEMDTLRGRRLSMDHTLPPLGGSQRRRGSFAGDASPVLPPLRDSGATSRATSSKNSSAESTPTMSRRAMRTRSDFSVLLEELGANGSVNGGGSGSGPTPMSLSPEQLRKSRASLTPSVLMSELVSEGEGEEEEEEEEDDEETREMNGIGPVVSHSGTLLSALVEANNSSSSITAVEHGSDKSGGSGGSEGGEGVPSRTQFLGDVGGEEQGGTGSGSSGRLGFDTESNASSSKSNDYVPRARWRRQRG